MHEKHAGRSQLKQQVALKSEQQTDVFYSTNAMYMYAKFYCI